MMKMKKEIILLADRATVGDCFIVLSHIFQHTTLFRKFVGNALRVWALQSGLVIVLLTLRCKENGKLQ
jgi:hypothetical protein